MARLAGAASMMGRPADAGGATPESLVGSPGAPVLRTRRLVLRPFTAADLDDLHAMDGDAEVMRYLGSGLPPRSREECARAIAAMADSYRQRPGFGLLHASTHEGEFVGGCGVFPVPEGDDVEIAYRLPRSQWGHGYATEMAAAVLHHALWTLGLPRVIGLAWPGNTASQHVLEKIGMVARGSAFHYGREMRLYVAEVPPQ